MQRVHAGIIGLGNVGTGTLDILAQNWEQIENKLGFPLQIAALCSRSIESKKLPDSMKTALRTTNWREVVNNPGVDIVVELVGGTGVAREIVEAAIEQKKHVITANKELMALAGAELWAKAAAAGVTLSLEASVAGGIPIHTVLRDGIAGDRVQALYGILNGTCNYILTEIEKHGKDFDAVLAEAQQLGYAEADPSADVDGYDARSKLAILAALSFGEHVPAADIYTEGIRRLSPVDFDYAHRLQHTIRLICSARRRDNGLALSVRPSLIPQSTIMASVQGAYNAIWVKGEFGQDTFYYGRGAGPHPTGVAVVSDLLRIARDMASGKAPTSPYGFTSLARHTPVPVTDHKSAYFLRFRVEDQPGIIARLAAALADQQISIEAVLQLPSDSWRNLPFVITVEPATEQSIRNALSAMKTMRFLKEPPLAMPMEKGL